MQWKHWFAPYPELDHIQLEVTTYCNAFCSYCPRTTAGDAWANVHFNPELLRSLIPFLSNVPYVHLQGWGEPLLNPRFFELVAIAKQFGCHCGTTTNGTTVTVENANKLVGSGIDVVAFSLTGTGPSHERFRKGAPVNRVLDGIRNLADAGKQNSVGPDIHIAYLLLRDGMDELMNLPTIIGSLPVKEIVVNTLDYVPHPELDGQVISRGSTEWDTITGRLEKIKKMLAARGTRLVYESLASDAKTGTCSENVDRALIIAADGGIHPCVFSNLPDPVTGLKRKCFGRLATDGLDTIWWSSDYRRFRDSFASDEPDKLCVGCPKRTL